MAVARNALHAARDGEVEDDAAVLRLFEAAAHSPRPVELESLVVVYLPDGCVFAAVWRGTVLET